MEEIEIVVLNDKKYYVIDRINKESDTYILLLNVEDETDMCVRKELSKDDKKYLAKLNDEEELKTILNLFANK